MTETAKNNIPWVEKYRPQHFEEIVLDPMNRTIFKNILDKNYFPNLLFYGPPGTGKTTTIINLINEHQRRYSQINKSNVIHLNASDERGIDIIRNQIYQFVRSKNMFEKGLRFVILDEVDYMTKNAQQALKYLLQSSESHNVRFCLICNYISKIDVSLKNEFISIRFNQLPKDDILHFIKHVTTSEHIDMPDEVIKTIQYRFESDIRSMINFIQLNQRNLNWKDHIITDAAFEEIHRNIFLYKIPVGDIIADFHQKSKQYNMDQKNILIMYFNYIIRMGSLLSDPEIGILSSGVLDRIKNSIHIQDADIISILNYFTSSE
jgi:replication factor C subunit 3/5